MLREIYCDKFVKNKGKENETPRGRIPFEKGLNVIQGHSTGQNSIGKSTFLLVVDFVFGGDDYANDYKILNAIKAHTICFSFEFDNKLYYFSRNTGNSSVVYICNEDYQPNDEMSIDNFRIWLLNSYKINLPNVHSIRSIISLFFRVYGRNNVFERQALATVPQEKKELSLISYMKLYNLFEDIRPLYEKLDYDTKHKDAILKAENFEIKRRITKAIYEENLATIFNFENERKRLLNKGTEEIELDDGSTEQAVKSKAEIEKLNKIKKNLWANYYKIKNSAEFRKPATQTEFDELSKYFPNVNLQELEKIENFHNKLSEILNPEFQSAMSSIRTEINIISNKIKQLEEIMEEIKLPQQMSKKTLESYGKLYKETSKLKEENDFYIAKKKLSSDIEEEKKKYEIKFKQQADKLVGLVNKKVSELNSYIYGALAYPPKLKIIDNNMYRYEVETDGGTGTNYKNLILIDLATLYLTELPTLAHDTILFKNIEQEAMAKIVDLYMQSNKQIFITFDETTKYPQETKKIIEEKTVLRLSANGNELYGYSWSKKKTN